MKVIVTNIQRFCLHDGSGIRTTVFFKGCNLRCPWCSNPENIDFNIQQYSLDGENGIYGKEYELEELEKEVLKDINYYSNDGGVTFSGGEALWKMKDIEPLLISLQNKNINMCIETALTVPKEYLSIALKYINEFIVDIKIIDKNNVSKINGNVDLFLENIEELFKSKKNVLFRIPIVPKYTYTKENIEEILKLLNKYKPNCVEIFKIHNLGEKKYKTLNMSLEKFDEVLDSEIEEIHNKIANLGINCKIIKI